MKRIIWILFITIKHYIQWAYLLLHYCIDMKFLIYSISLIFG